MHQNSSPEGIRGSMSSLTERTGQVSCQKGGLGLDFSRGKLTPKDGRHFWSRFCTLPDLRLRECSFLLFCGYSGTPGKTLRTTLKARRRAPGGRWRTHGRWNPAFLGCFSAQEHIQVPPAGKCVASLGSVYLAAPFRHRSCPRARLKMGRLSGGGPEMTVCRYII